MPHARELACSKLSILLALNPTSPVMETVGKKAAVSAPSWAFAANTSRSAAAISGLRSKSCEGNTFGIFGKSSESGEQLKSKLEGDFPSAFQTVRAGNNCAKRSQRLFLRLERIYQVQETYQSTPFIFPFVIIKFTSLQNRFCRLPKQRHQTYIRNYNLFRQRLLS